MLPAPPSNAGPVREAHRFDEARLDVWMSEHVDGYSGSLQVRQFKGGQSNPTFWLADRERQYALRKKPPGKLLQSAHMVDREYRVMHALRDTDVPTAKMYALCEDDSVIGTSFFVMEYVQGRLFWNVQLPKLEPNQRTAIYDELARVLAAIHSVDLEATGLSDYGRPDAYVARQVKRWTKQYIASQTSDVAQMNTLIEWLPANVPADEATSLVHGDYRLDNLIFHPAEPRALAVIDWELSTLGHPLSDLAYTCMLYDVMLPKIGGLAGVDFETSGIPSEDAFVARYCELVGRDGVPDLSYYKAFSLFRLAAIAQGVYKRSIDGNASSTEASMFGAAVPHLAGIACELVGIG
ncbi:MAG: phosphotransferase [Myxococcales bacterium]|nr:MAG: phosphotransferase [Myxococcales bacterium]